MKDITAAAKKLMNEQSVVCIGSVDARGYPNVKAMLAPCRREGLRTFYFHTNTSSMRVKQYRDEPKACLYAYDQRLFRGVMLLGRMQVLEDAAHKELLWQEGNALYYPLGVTDPDYCVLRFTAESGRFYSSFHSESFEITE